MPYKKPQQSSIKLVQFWVSKSYYATAGTQFNWHEDEGMAGIGFSAEGLKNSGMKGIVQNHTEGKTIQADLEALYHFTMRYPESYQIIDKV